MKTQAMLTLFAAATFVLGGCASVMTPEAYSASTRSLLETKSQAIKSCYDAALTTSKDAGAVTVHFKVQQTTGKIVDAKLDGGAPPALAMCVTQALDGLTLMPADPNDGIATFTWDFTIGPPRAP